MKRVLSILPSALLLLVLTLTPFTYIPGLLEPRELPKQLLVLCVAVLSALVAIALVQGSRSFSWRTGHILLVGLAVSFLVSSLLSQYSFASFVGQGRSEYLAFITIAALVLLVLSAAQGKVLSDIVISRSLAAPAVIGAIFVLLHYVGLVESFTFMGNTTQFLLLLVVSAIPVTSFLLKKGAKSYEVITAAGVLAVLFSSLVVFDNTELLGLFGVSQLAFVMLITRGHEVKSLRLTFILFVSLLSLVTIPFSTSIDSVFTVDVVPSVRSSLNIASEALGGARALFGTGTGTFALQYMQFQDTGIAQTAFWSLVFDRSTNFVITLAVSAGFVTLVVLLVLLIYSIAVALRAKELSLAFMLVILTAGAFLFPFNLTLVVWMLLLSGLAISYSKERSLKLDQTGAVVFGVVMLLVVSLGFGVGAAKAASQLSLLRGLSAYNDGEIEAALRQINTASRLNRQSDVLHRNLTTALILRLPSVIASESSDTEKERYVRALLSSAQRAIGASPNSAQNYALLGEAYAEVSPFVEGALPLAANAYDRAAELFPANPLYLVKASEVRLALYDQSAQREFETNEEERSFMEIRARVYDEAEELAAAALELRPGYPQALLQRARLLERSDAPGDAIEIYSALTEAFPQDTGLGLQYALALLRQGENERAITELERITRISPQFSNAHWYLSAAYELDGNLSAAEASLQDILAYEPENETVLARITELRDRIAAPELPEPLEDLEEPSEDLPVLEESSQVQ